MAARTFEFGGLGAAKKVFLVKKKVFANFVKKSLRICEFFRNLNCQLSDVTGLYIAISKFIFKTKQPNELVVCLQLDDLFSSLRVTNVFVCSKKAHEVLGSLS